MLWFLSEFPVSGGEAAVVARPVGEGLFVSLLPSCVQSLRIVLDFEECQSESSGLCELCASRPKDACLVHGLTGHQVCMCSFSEVC